ncbi:methyltransferase [Actinoplanes lobatus]|uniref:Methyltransferase n=1 Tax=Actinoplanes lobatus TaxID=113568 RepID=A0A7W7MJI0_9ACTN|nr:class I SAM-dependent methyltransferase [Actinoplanes lobatus]MBB4752478.1 SAM-dependent methyltransferase [Actinoplanes lobatus]GGN99832.1 methyltransferase [Actinoplanes lobatus]GIE46418.1 methyltransferase [Actinoplanes lobatus]
MENPGPFDQQADHWRRWAAFYDADSAGHLDPSPAVDALCDLAGDGPALELGIGSGRLALPLAARGIPVCGIDASPEMIDILHQRRAGLPVDARIADMADFRAPAPFPFPLVYVAASTFYLLGTADRQISCLRAIAGVLAAGGRFVIEAALPHTVIGDGRQIIVRHVDDGHAHLTIQAHDPTTQLVVSQEITFKADGTCRMLPSVMRYVTLPELDLMASIAGMRLLDRYGGWDWRPLTTVSSRHVSIYEHNLSAV